MNNFKVTRQEPYATRTLRATSHKQAARRSALAVPYAELIVEGAHKHVRFVVTRAGALYRQAVYVY